MFMGHISKEVYYASLLSCSLAVHSSTLVEHHHGSFLHSEYLSSDVSSVIYTHAALYLVEVLNYLSL